MPTKLAYKSAEGKNEINKIYDSLLENWVTPNEKLKIKTQYGDTYIIASGPKEAPPVVLLHGSAMNSVMWMKEAREYSRDYRVYAVDIPGEPGKSEEKQLPFEGHAFADWLNDVFNALSIEKANIVGISLGAWLSIKFSIHFPERVDKLVLLCPAGIGPQRKSFLFKVIAHMLMGEKGLEKLYKKVNGNQPMPEVVLEYQKLIGKYFNFRREIIPLFSDSELKRLTMPVALFVGGKDVMFHSDMTAERLGAVLPHSNINILPEAGHALINLTDKIHEFLISGA